MTDIEDSETTKDVIESKTTSNKDEVVEIQDVTLAEGSPIKVKKKAEDVNLCENISGKISGQKSEEKIQNNSGKDILKRNDDIDVKKENIMDNKKIESNQRKLESSEESKIVTQNKQSNNQNQKELQKLPEMKQTGDNLSAIGAVSSGKPPDLKLNSDTVYVKCVDNKGKIYLVPQKMLVVPGQKGDGKPPTLMKSGAPKPSIPNIGVPAQPTCPKIAFNMKELNLALLANKNVSVPKNICVNATKDSQSLLQGNTIKMNSLLNKSSISKTNVPTAAGGVSLLKTSNLLPNTGVKSLLSGKNKSKVENKASQNIVYTTVMNGQSYLMQLPSKPDNNLLMMSQAGGATIQTKGGTAMPGGATIQTKIVTAQPGGASGHPGGSTSLGKSILGLKKRAAEQATSSTGSPVNLLDIIRSDANNRHTQGRPEPISARWYQVIFIL